jgi:hypothetical protein
LRQNAAAGAWVLDPFGASPRLVVEAARAGWRVLSAVNNPIARFLLELNANPPAESELRASLAELAVSQKGSERLEPHLRALYHTECAACGSTIEAEAFTWERGASAPSGRFYACPHCNDRGEHPATTSDIRSAARFTSSDLHRARALERVAPLDDPDRVYVEEALSMYLPRAVYALFTLVNKLDSFPTARRRRLVALLLAALDQANLLWAHPAARLRPRQLTAPARFLEKNVWLALEEAVERWPASLPASAAAGGAPLSFTIWPELPSASGGICLYEGRLKDLAGQIQGETLQVEAVLSTLPRPNQAYWTLSALWAGWLWGHEASASFHSVLRRRRYDWDWHCQALYSTLRSLAQMVPPGAPALGLVSEAEPGFLTSALLAAEMSGFDLMGIALRPGEGQAQIHWKRSAGLHPAQRIPQPSSPAALEESSQRAALEYLRQRGEPATYLHLHAAALSRLAQEHRWSAASQDKAAEPSPTEQMELTEKALQNAFGPQSGFTRYGTESRALEAGWWWAEALAGAAEAGVLALADRAEMEVVRFLLKNPACSSQAVERAVCAALRGLLTPEKELLIECLVSYAKQDASDEDLWQLRAEDAPSARRADLEAIRALIVRAGERLGYLVETGELPEGDLRPQDTARSLTRTPICWKQAGGSSTYTFYCIASGLLGHIVFTPPAAGQGVIVLPGGRARLVEYKQRRDLRLAQAIAAGWRFIKFRHLRRLASDDTLTQQNFEQRLALDPLANQDPQTALF